MKQIAALLLTLFALIQDGQADNATRAAEMLDQISRNQTQSTGTEVSYRLTVQPSNDEPAQQFNGQLKMKGEKFTLTSPEISVWFNGKEQWSLSESSDEVNLTEPTEEELQSVNPYFLLKNYKKEYTCQLKKEGKTDATIELTPKNSGGDIVSVTLLIDTKKGFPIAITVKNKDKSSQHVSITKYTDGLNFDDSLFVFEPKQHPGKEINDLR